MSPKRARFELILHTSRDPLRAHNFSYKNAPHASESSIFEVRASQNQLILTRFWASKTKPKFDPENNLKMHPRGPVISWRPGAPPHPRPGK